MKMYIYELDHALYADANAPKILKGCTTHVLNIPDDAIVTTLKGKPTIVLPPKSKHSPRITLTLEIALFAARKKTIIDLYEIETFDGPPNDYTTSA